MLGAIAGDIIGSVFEHRGVKTKDFELFSESSTFTDDTVLTLALADSIMAGIPYAENLKRYCRLYPGRGYGGGFAMWAASNDNTPYNSFGNGAAMRISPVGFAFNTLEEVLDKAKQYTEVTHDHPEGIKGGQATASAVFLARTGKTKGEIREFVEKTFKYDLSRTCDEIRPAYRFDETCQGTVPQAIRAFLDSTDFKDAIRNAVSLGGDADTLACITGGIAHAFYGCVPDDIREEALDALDDRLDLKRMEFEKRFGF